MLLAGILLITLIIGNGLYYCSGILKKMGAISAEEMNESELFVTREGELEEVFPEEDVTETEIEIINVISRISFLLISSLLWVVMGVTVGRIAYILRPEDLWKLIVYFLIYLFLLRMPFGIINRSIEKSFEVKLMPDKMVIAIIALGSYIVGINYYEYLPSFLMFHLQIIDQGLVAELMMQ